MSRLKKKLFDFLKNHQKVGITPQAIRNEISRIRRNNPSLTMNAAAKVFADKRGISVMKYLNEEDRKSLNYASERKIPKQTIIKTKRINIKNILPKYGKNFISDANKNTSAYPYLYILENSFRKLILDIFGNEVKWWKNTKIVPKKVQEYAFHIQEAEKKHDWLPKRGNHPIYYVGLNELCKIIEKNYSKNFKDIFTDKGNLRTWVNECIPIRNLLAHNVRLRDREIQNLKIRTEYLCTLIEKK
jgi:hypothetical protein